MVLCDPYGSRARKSERNRHMRVGAGLRSNEKVLTASDKAPRDVGRAFTLLQRLPWKTLKQRKGSSHIAGCTLSATALAFVIAEHHSVQSTALQYRSLTSVFTVHAPCLKLNQGGQRWR